MTEDASGRTQEASRPRLEIDWLKTVAGALAAVSSAVVLSTLGAAGTLIGAALGSVVLTVGNALYGQGLERSRQRLTRAQRDALRDVGVADSAVRRADRNLEDSEPEDSELEDSEPEGSEPEDTSDPPAGWRDRLALLPWKRIALVASALFVVSVVLITAFELLAGRSVASYTGGANNTGGTSLTRLGGGGSDDPADRPGSPSDSTSPSDGTSDQPSEEPSTGSSDTAEVEPSTPLTESTEPELTEPTETTSPTLAEPTSPAPTPTPAETPTTP